MKEEDIGQWDELNVPQRHELSVLEVLAEYEKLESGVVRLRGFVDYEFIQKELIDVYGRKLCLRTPVQIVQGEKLKMVVNRQQVRAMAAVFGISELTIFEGDIIADVEQVEKTQGKGNSVRVRLRPIMRVIPKTPNHLIISRRLAELLGIVRDGSDIRIVGLSSDPGTINLDEI